MRTIGRRTCRFVIGIVVLVLVSASLVSAATPDLHDKLDEFLKASHDVQKFQGAVLVAKKGVPILSAGYGMANIELNAPNTDQTEFLIGSVTKQFTATCIMQLVEAGKLKVTDTLTKILPDYPKENGDKITIKNLLTHTSGIPNYTDMPDLDRRKFVPITVDSLIASFSSLPLQFEPGARFSYSNSNYVILGAIIEKLSGEKYADYLNNHIFGPLKMTHSGYTDNRAILPGRAEGYFQDDSDKLVNADRVEMSFPFSAGALYSDVGDLSIWDQALYTNKLLSKKSREEMFTPYRDNYGYAFVNDTIFGHRRIWHNGAIDGFHSAICRFIDDSLCIIVLSNNLSSPVEMISQELAAIVFGQPYDVPVVKQPIAIDPRILQQYVGVYQVEPDVYRVMTVSAAKLYSQRTGGQQLPLEPEAKDKFYLEKDNSTTLTFLRDDSGKVYAHIIHQGGVDDTAQLVTGPVADSILAQRTVAKIDPKIYDDYVGDYQLMPGFILTITRQGDQIFAQATNQGINEIYPSSENEFFLKVVDAQIKFERDSTGKVTGLTLYQAGQVLPAAKIK